MILNIQPDSLDLSSREHKTYANPSASPRFRDLIELVVGAFLDATNLPIISRIGLRYIDQCPLPSPLVTPGFREYYDTCFPLTRFPLEEAMCLESRSTVKRGGHHVTYRETFMRQDDAGQLQLDFDGFAEDVASDDYLATTDRLHELVIEEYERTVKQPVIEIMRTPPESEGA